MHRSAVLLVSTGQPPTRLTAPTRHLEGLPATVRCVRPGPLFFAGLLSPNYDDI